MILSAVVAVLALEHEVVRDSHELTGRLEDLVFEESTEDRVSLSGRVYWRECSDLLNLRYGEVAVVVVEVPWSYHEEIGIVEDFNTML